MSSMSIHAKLAKIQQSVKAPKGQYNQFGKFRYRSVEDIQEAVKPLLDGCWLTLSDEVVLIGDRHYVRATAMLSDGESTITNHAYAREADQRKGMDPSQVTGATSSYARKYALGGLLLLDDTKDADSDAGPPPERKPRLAAKPGPAELETEEDYGPAPKSGLDGAPTLEDALVEGLSPSPSPEEQEIAIASWLEKIEAEISIDGLDLMVPNLMKLKPAVRDHLRAPWAKRRKRLADLEEGEGNNGH